MQQKGIICNPPTLSRLPHPSDTVQYNYSRTPSPPSTPRAPHTRALDIPSPFPPSFTPPNLSPSFQITLYTKCPGSKKFGTPSNTLYSCAQFPHTSFPSLTVVSSNILCRSLAVWLGTSSTASAPSVDPVAPVPGSIRSSRVGGVTGSGGSPSYTIISFRPYPCLEKS